METRTHTPCQLQELVEAETASKQQKRKRRLPPGTSDYQAAWILDDNEEGASGNEERCDLRCNSYKIFSYISSKAIPYPCSTSERAWSPHMSDVLLPTSDAGDHNDMDAATEAATEFGMEVQQGWEGDRPHRACILGLHFGAGAGHSGDGADTLLKTRRMRILRRWPTCLRRLRRDSVRPRRMRSFRMRWRCPPACPLVSALPSTAA